MATRGKKGAPIGQGRHGSGAARADSIHVRLDHQVTGVDMSGDFIRGQSSRTQTFAREDARPYVRTFLLKFLGKLFAALANPQEADIMPRTQKTGNQLPELLFYQRIANSKMTHYAADATFAAPPADGRDAFRRRVFGDRAGNGQPSHRRFRWL